MSSSSQNPDPASVKRIVMDVSRDGWTKGIQLGISELDVNGGGHGYRIAGPKYNGSQERLLECELTRRDADEIRQFLDVKFPQETVSQASGLRIAAAAILAEQDRLEAVEKERHGSLDHETKLQGEAVREMRFHLLRLAHGLEAGR